ncbi:MAG: hypothetical protein V3T77_11145 [Planctomycetota bacterium]
MANPMTADELEFVRAVEEYKKQKSKTFLPWTEVLSIIKALGYRKSVLNRKKTAKKTVEAGKKAVEANKKAVEVNKKTVEADKKTTEVKQ